MLSSPHLSRTLIYNVSRWWGLYLNKCGGAFYSKALEGPGANIPFLLEPIPFELKEGAYVGPILSVPLLDLIAVQRMSGSGRNGSGICDSGTFSDRSSGGGGGGGGSGAGGDVFAVKVKKVGAPGWGGGARVWVRYDVHLPALPLWDGENLEPYWQGPSSLPCTDKFFARTGTCVGYFGRTVSIKTRMSLPPPPRGGDRHFWAVKNIRGVLI